MKLWEYTTGQKLQSWDLHDLEETLVPKTENEGVTMFFNAQA